MQYNIDASFNNMSMKEPVYYDVVGMEPEGHPLLDDYHDVDYHNILLNPQQHAQEIERAIQLSQKRICNAPPWYSDLPWDEMDDISFEELIIYFPNHVVRWPFLALGLRKLGWDRLFFRTARLINLARGSHYRPNRQNKHTETLPIMLKVEAAIQEIDARYTLSDHHRWDYQITMDWIWEHRKTNPKCFVREGHGTVTFAEITHYVHRHAFEDRPFSRRVRRAHISPHLNINYPSSEPATNYWHFQRYLPEQQSHKSSPGTTSIEEDTGAFADGEETDVDTAPGIYPWGPNCKRSNRGAREKSHAADLEKQGSQPKQKMDGDRRDPENTPCRHDLDCKKRNCRYRHTNRGANPGAQPGEPPQREKLQRHGNPQQEPPPSNLKRKKPCSFNGRCRNTRCPFGHPAPAAPPGASASSDETCPYDAQCTDAKCHRSHGSPARTRSGNGEQWKKGAGGRDGGNREKSGNYEGRDGRSGKRCGRGGYVGSGAANGEESVIRKGRRGKDGRGGERGVERGGRGPAAAPAPTRPVVDEGEML